MHHSRLTFVALTAATLLTVSPLSRGQSISPEKEKAISAEVSSFMERYTEWFAAGRADLIAERGYSSPAIHLGATAFAAMSAAEVKQGFEAFLKPLIEDGYVRSEWTERYIHVLHEGAAIVSGAFIRYRKDGTKIGLFAGTYVLGKMGDGWRITALATHDPSRVIPRK